MLQYASAFDDEVLELLEDGSEQPQLPEGILESVLEEVPDIEPEPPEDIPEEPPACQSDTSRNSTNMVHGPYYYFYQGV